MMHTVRFPLNTDQLELLAAFEQSSSLQQLSDTLFKDSSVISKKLKKISEIAPVIKKVSGKWQITPVGRSINDISRSFAVKLSNALPAVSNISNLIREDFLQGKLVLMLVNTQKAFHDPIWGLSSTPQAAKNIQMVLDGWRKSDNKVIHVKHISDDVNHPFYIDNAGTEIMAGLEPLPSETVINKSSASAFTDTNLGVDLKSNEVNSIVLTGFTASECVDATAKQASDLGFKNYVVGDATATFQLPGDTEKKYSSSDIHSFTMARLNKIFADVIHTDFLLNSIAK